MKFTFITLAFVSFASQAHADPAWYVSNGDSCTTVCHAHGSEPFVTGYFSPNHTPFLLCAADFRNEGDRPGYNLDPKWSHVCVIPYAGQEVQVSTYKCFCGGPR